MVVSVAAFASAAEPVIVMRKTVRKNRLSVKGYA
jgi:hypothetical protein